MNILLAGRLDFGPIARHLRAFIETLSANPDNEIYIDSYYIDLFRADFFGTKELLQHYLELDNVHLASPEMQYDAGIFTDLLTLQYNDTYYREFLKRDCKLRICYEVFDGSIPPLDWIEIINNDFDICCAPSVYIRDCLVKNGVKIPCFNLPCVVFNDELLAMSPRKKDIFRFGFVGGAEQRKNLLKVIETRAVAFVSLMYVTASLERRETRAGHYREDYPVRNENELAWLCLRKGEGLAPEFYRVPVPLEEYRFPVTRYYQDNFTFGK